MNAFDSACGVEARGRAILLPYLEERSDQLLLVLKGPLARHLQLHTGDMLANFKDGTTRSVELKIEQRFTGNLFLETWSNRNLEDRANHEGIGSNPGWMVHLGCNIIMYYFLDTDDLFAIDAFALKRWAFGHGEVAGNIYRYPEKFQQKYKQKNDTGGRIVPVNDLSKALGRAFRQCKVRQLQLLESAA